MKLKIEFLRTQVQDCGFSFIKFNFWKSENPDNSNLQKLFQNFKTYMMCIQGKLKMCKFPVKASAVQKSIQKYAICFLLFKAFILIEL